MGKTRTLAEAVKTVLPEWWLVHPTDATAVRSFAKASTQRTVLWLDELQRYLNHPGGLPAGVLRDMLTAGLVIVATLWPDEYSKRAAPRAPGRHDPYENDREVLGLAQVIEVPTEFSPGELQRAWQLTGDRRISAALAARDAGVTQVLAAGPEFVRWWEHGYVTADYLYQHAISKRNVEVADSVWQALVEHHPDDLQVLAEHARSRGQQHYSELFYRRAADSGSKLAAYHLASRLVNQERVDEAIEVLQQHADHGDDYANVRMIGLMGRQRRINDLRQRAATGDWYASKRLVDLLVERGDVAEAITILEQRANVGDRYTTKRLASLLAEQKTSA